MDAINSVTEHAVIVYGHYIRMQWRDHGASMSFDKALTLLPTAQRRMLTARWAIRKRLEEEAAAKRALSAPATSPCP